MSASSNDTQGVEEDLISFSPSKPSTFNERQEGTDNVDLWAWLKGSQTPSDGKNSSMNTPPYNGSGSDSGEDEDLGFHQRLLDDDGMPARPAPVHPTTSPSSSNVNSSTPSVIEQVALTDPYVDEFPPVLPPVSEPGLGPRRETGKVVVIYDLPYDITVRDILSRIRTGEVRNVMLSKTNPALVRGLREVVIIFKEVRAALEFVHNSRNFESIWTFRGYHAYNLYDEIEWTARVEHVPNLITGKLVNNPEDWGAVVKRPFVYDDKATRCLYIENCPFEVIEEIWYNLDLHCQLPHPHYMSNFEDIWVDGFRTGEDGHRIEVATLHIWFICESLATAMLQRVFDKFRRLPRHAWARRMTYEKDPCESGRAYEAFFRPMDDPGFAWNSIPSQSLLEAYKAGTLGKLFDEWREISMAVRGDRAYRAYPNTTSSPDDPVMPLLRCNAYVSALFEATCQDDFYPVHSLGTPVRAALAKSVFEERWYMQDGDAVSADPQQEAEQEAEAEHELEHELESEQEPEPETTQSSQPETSQTHQPKPADDIPPAANSLEAMRNPVGFRPSRVSGSQVSLEEFLACDATQLAAMGTVFYKPPKGHNSFEWVGGGL